MRAGDRMIAGKVRARVLKVEGQVVTLGVYLRGVWHRVRARTELPLEVGCWINGHLTVPSDGSMVHLKVFELESPSGDGSSSGGLDVEV